MDIFKIFNTKFFNDWGEIAKSLVKFDPKNYKSQNWDELENIFQNL